jgi:hypothetical protein
MYAALPEAGRRVVRKAVKNSALYSDEDTIANEWNKRGAVNFYAAPMKYTSALRASEHEDILRAVEELLEADQVRTANRA